MVQRFHPGLALGSNPTLSDVTCHVTRTAQSALGHVWLLSTWDVANGAEGVYSLKFWLSHVANIPVLD